VVNFRDFSGYFTSGPGSSEIGKNHNISKKLGIFNSLLDVLTQVYINQKLAITPESYKWPTI
jgi:hypothetical protein